MPGKKNFLLFLFCFTLLCITCLLRSSVIVDKSFLPRFLLLTLLLLATYLVGLRKKIRFNGLYAFSFVLFYLWNLFSGLWAISPSEAIMQSQLVFISLAVFLIIDAFRSEYPAVEIIFIRVLIIALFFSFGLAFVRMASLPFYDPYKINSVCANNNLYAGFLLICLPLLFAGYSLQKGFWRYLSVCAGIFSVFFIIIIQSRAVYLGLMAAVLIALLILVFRYRSVFSRKNLLIGLVALLLLFSGVLWFYSSLDTTRRNYFMSKVPVWNYFKSYDTLLAEKARKQREAARGDLNHMPEFDYAENYYENANLRLIFWKKSFCLIHSHPLAGVGAGNWRLAVPSCKAPVNPEHTIKNYTYSQPHNEWINLFSELGIIGLILSFFVFFIPPGWVFYQLLTQKSRPLVTSVFYAAFVIGFYFFASFDFPFHRVEHLVMLFSLLAFLCAGTGIARPVFRIGKLPMIVFSIVFTLLLLFSLLVGSARIAGEYYTMKMFRDERKNDARVITLCRKAENPFYRISPNTLPLTWFEGVAFYRTGDIASAANCFSRALQSTPYEVRVLNDYGISLYDLKRGEEGKSYLLKSVDIDPFFDDAKFNLAVIYYFNGQKDSALYYVNGCRDSQKKTDFLKEMMNQ